MIWLNCLSNQQSFCFLLPFVNIAFCFQKMSDKKSEELGKRRRGPPPRPFSAWQPGDAAMQGQRKKKQREKEERKKEASRVEKYRDTKKKTAPPNDKSLPEEYPKKWVSFVPAKCHITLLTLPPVAKEIVSKFIVPTKHSTNIYIIKKYNINILLYWIYCVTSSLLFWF